MHHRHSNTSPPPQPTKTANHSPADAAAPRSEHDTARLRKAVIGGSIGNAVEWFDYNIYGFLAVYIGAAFFPSSDPLTSLLAAFAVFAVTFVARPIGGLFFGVLGDRIGRQRTLVIVLFGISAATFTVGTLPDYHQIGVAAPIILVLARFAQGFSAGGEFGASLAYLTEHAPPVIRGRITVWQNISAMLAGLAASSAVAGLTLMVSVEGMANGWWRAPFLIAAPLGIVGYIIRTRIDESPTFVALEQGDKHAKAPLASLFRNHKGPLLTCFVIGTMHTIGYYTIITYFSNSASTAAGGKSHYSYLAPVVIYCVSIISMTIAARLSDKVGRKPLMMAACVCYVVVGVPASLLYMNGSVFGLLVGPALLGIGFGIFCGPPFTAMAEAFPASVRVSGIAVAYNSSAAIFGGTAPYISTLLVKETGISIIPIFVVMGFAVITALVAIFMRDRTGERLPLA